MYGCAYEYERESVYLCVLNIFIYTSCLINKRTTPKVKKKTY